VHEVLTDGEDAILFSPRDPQDLAEKVKAVIADPKLAAEIAARGSRSVREKYTWDRFAGQIEDAFQEAAQAAKLPSLRAHAPATSR
jgi:glycosyltransferase involved in cell wall biosynthesis